MRKHTFILPFKATIVALTLISVTGLTLTGCSNKTLQQQKARSNEPIKPIVADKDINPEKVELGKMMFFDGRLSRAQNISCATCHNLSRGGSDNLAYSVGYRWRKEEKNTPTVLNAKYNAAQFWDGRAKNLYDQSLSPMVNHDEMADSDPMIIKTISSIPYYRAAFKKVYNMDQITMNQIADAIGNFERTLVTPDSRFDLWLKGDNKAITAQEKNGYDLFKSVGCIVCHTGTAVGGVGKDAFAKIGFYHPYKSPSNYLGLYDVTKKESDKYKFKIPNLRNVELTAPYFHDGQMTTLTETVNAMAWLQLNKKLTPQENADIVSFLKTLTGKQPKIDLPILPPNTDQTPRPIE